MSSKGQKAEEGCRRQYTVAGDTLGKRLVDVLMPSFLLNWVASLTQILTISSSHERPLASAPNTK